MLIPSLITTWQLDFKISDVCMKLSALRIPPLWRRGGFPFYFCLRFHPFQFTCHSFLSNYWSQLLEHFYTILEKKITTSSCLPRTVYIFLVSWLKAGVPFANRYLVLFINIDYSFIHLLHYYFYSAPWLKGNARLKIQNALNDIYL